MALPTSTKSFLKFLVLITLFFTNSINAQQLAFPGAEGGGRFATGGRGGSVYEVTTLNDAGVGSLRDAVSQPNRTIVFKVSGIIRLVSRLTIRQPNLTIAGQTAPGDGICIAGYTVNINASNIILRHLRFRLGDDSKIDDDALNSFGSSITNGNIIIDHCSLSWSVDETGTFYNIKDFTLQWCILSESLFRSVHDKGNHGYAGIWGGQNATFHHNLVAHHTSRNPRFNGSRYTGRPDLEVVDFRNNVIYNWGSANSAYGGEGGNYNMVNNYYKAGPATPGNLTASSASNKRNRILNYTSYYYSSDAAVYPDTLFGGKFYIEGNYVHGYTDVTNDNWTRGVQKDNYAKADSLIAAARQSAPFATAPVTTQSAEEAYLSVLENVGATLPHRDAVDVRIINETRTGTATYEGAAYAAVNGTGISHPSGIIDTQNDVGGLPSYRSTTAPTDTDKDGMPDSWETANGLNPNDANDGNTVSSNGYTALESYLNSITTSGSANTTPNIIASGSLASFAQTGTTPSAIQTYTLAGNNLTGTVTVTPPANFEVSANNGTTWFTQTSSLSLTPVNGTLGTTKISVRLNASSVGSYSGNIVHNSSGIQSVSVAVNGITSTAVAPSSSVVLQQWALTANNNDDAATRSASVVPSVPTFNRFVSADSAIAPYHSTTGQAFAPTGKGYWASDAPGPGGNLNRTFYEQFIVKASSGYSVKVDSLLLNTAISGSQSNTKLAVVYSKSGFTTADSTEVTGATFVAPTMTTQYSSTNYPKYSFALSGSTGVTLEAGQTLTIRLYYSCGSTSRARFALLKNVIVKGVPTTVAAAPIVAATGSFNTFTNSAGTPSAVQTFSVSGDNLKSDVIVTAPAGYELSRDGTSWASQTIALSPTSGSLAATTVSVRLNAATAGSYNGDITVSSSDATSAALAVTGTTNPAAATPAVTASGSLTNFLHTAGRPSAAQSITVSGSNLSGNVVVTPATPFEVSANGVNWFNHTSPLTFTNNNGGLTASNLLVRLNATSAGAYNGNVVITSTGANNVTVPASGTTNAQSTFVYSSTTADAVVARDGSAQYTTIQAAINAAPTNRTTPYIIYIKNGKYVEKVNIPSNKPNIQLIGESAANTIISWDSYSGKVENGVIIGTSTSATLTVNSNDFFMMNIMVENSSGYVGDGPQALALYIVGDRAGFKNCRFISGQDTVWHNGDGKRHYFKDCYIDGNTDFVFGSSIALFENCTIFPRDRIDGSGGGYITAANTPAGQTYGEVFRDSRITKNRGVTNYTMGRPWQNDQGKESKTVFLNTTMASSIVPAGWSVWDANTRPALITYAEYKSRKWDGDLVDVSQRVSWSKQLSDNEAAAYYANSNLFGTWDAGAQFPALLKDIPVELAISNFRAQRGAENTTLSWNISWPVGAVTYTLYRSTDNINFTKINEFTSEPESVVAFSLTDAAPAKGTLYYYYVTASKAGMASHTSYTAIVDPSLPLDGEFRSAGSGLWTNASSGNGTNTNSIWERYSASTSSWVLQAKGVQPNSVNVTVRSGHTVILDGLKNANNLTFENGAALKGNGGYTTTPTAQTLRIGAGSAASVSIQNDGVFGGDNNPDDMIIVEFNTACSTVLWTGTGTSKITRIRPLQANPNHLGVTFDHDLSLSFSSPGFTAYYNSATNTIGENVTYTINAGKTIKLTHPSASFSPTGTTTTNPAGNYTYNINGTLDLGATTSTSNVVPFSTNAASVVALNIGSEGKLILGSGGLNTVNSAPSASNNGKVVLKIADGGFVDASKSNTLSLGANYFITEGSGALKRRVAATAVTFPIGTSGSNYNPVVLTNAGTADNFTVSVKNTFDNTVPAADKVVNKQWTIKEDVEGGSNVTVKAGWNVEEQAANFDHTWPIGIMTSAATGWTETNASVTGTGTVSDPYFATATGFTTFNYFGVTNTKVVPSITIIASNYTYDGAAKVASGFASGKGGTSDVLTPAVTLSYEGLNSTVYGPSADAPVHAGNYKVTASFAGNDRYSAATNTAGYTISARSITIKANATTKIYGDTDPTFTYQVVSGSLVGTDKFDGSLARTTGETIGSYAINQNTVSAGKDYVVTYTADNLTIKERELTITASNRTKECGALFEPGTTAFVSEGLQFQDAISGVTLKSDGVTGGVGSYVIIPLDANGTGISNYTIRYIAGKLVVTDNLKPLPDVAQLPEVTGECSATVITVPTATDACTGSIKGTTTDPLTYSAQGTYNVTWSFSDGNGNITTQTQSVIVKDVTKPVITNCPVVPVQCYNTAGKYTIPTLKATDNCGSVKTNYSISGATVRSGANDASGTFNVGKSIIRWVVTDVAGNEATCEIVVVVNKPLTIAIPDVFAVQKGGAANTIYQGYGPTSLTLRAQVTGGTAPYSYKWTEGSSAGKALDTSDAFTVEPISSTTYYLNVTDVYGCQNAAVVKAVKFIDVRCGAKLDRVSICEQQNGKYTTGCVTANNVQTQLNNGASLGACVNGTQAIASTNSVSAAENLTETGAGKLSVKVAPNPSPASFKLTAITNSSEPLTIRVIDMWGRAIETKTGVAAKATTEIGGSYRPGSYFAEVIQGKQKIVVKLVKQSS